MGTGVMTPVGRYKNAARRLHEQITCEQVQRAVATSLPPLATLAAA